MPLTPRRFAAAAIAATCVLAPAGCGGNTLSAPANQPQAYQVDVRDGTVERISGADRPIVDISWSPYGDALAYATPSRIVVRSEDGDARTIFEDSAATGLAVDWSPGGGSVAFAALANEDMERVGFVSTDGAVTRVLDSFRNDRGTEKPDWSPDGTRLAYTRPLGEFRLTGPSPKAPPGPQVDARPLRVFVTPASGGPAHVVPTGAAASDPQWSPDGRSLLLIADSGLVVRTTHDPATSVTIAGRQRVLQAAWAPNGRRIALVAVEPAGVGRQRIYVVTPAPGAVPQLLAPDEVRAGPAWSPDGSRVAYADFDGRIWTVRLLDGARQQVAATAGAEVSAVAWSPVDDSIAIIAAERPPEG